MLFVFTLRAHQAVFARRSFVTIPLIPLSSEKCVEGVVRGIQETPVLTTVLFLSIKDGDSLLIYLKER